MKVSAIISLMLISLATGRPANKEDTGLHSPEVPRHLLDLYNSIESSAAGSRLIDGANTARTLQNIAPVPSASCNMLSFSLSGMDGEIVLMSELNLYMTHHEPAHTPLYLVVRGLQLGDTVREISSDQESGWTAVSVTREVASMVKSGKTNAVFTVQIYNSIADYHNNEDSDLSCSNGPVSIAYSPTPKDNAPYLSVQSHDSHVDQIDFEAVLDKVKAKERQKRTPQLSPFCKVEQLIVHNDNLSEVLADRLIVPRSINIGICGRTDICSNSLVSHSQLLRYLIASKSYKVPQLEGSGSGTEPEVISVCAPIKYSSIDALLLGPSGVRIVRFRNLRVSKCGCVEVLLSSD